jgi:hypothetical protein
MRSKRNIRLVTTIIAVIALVLTLPCLSIAGSLEPPTTAVDSSGNPVPTVQIPPTWSQKLQCDTTACPRFEIVMDGAAVLDKETGLVWEQSPDTGTYSWLSAYGHCYGLVLGNRKGWRLPTVEELTSLVDPTVPSPGPTLPSGNLFANVQPAEYWSITTSPLSSTNAWVVYFKTGSVYASYSKDSSHYAWCVRGGHGYDAY